MVEQGGAARSLDWKEIDPRSLLGLHRTLIDKSTDDSARAKLLLNALAYGWLNDLIDESRGIAQELAGLRPDFSVQWEQILEDFGQ